MGLETRRETLTRNVYVGVIDRISIIFPRNIYKVKRKDQKVP